MQASHTVQHINCRCSWSRI